MIWLTWRQLRTQAVAVYAALLVLAGLLLLTASSLTDLRDTYGQRFLPQISGTDQTLSYLSVAAMILLPPLIGMFWGAPLIARELENGTHRLAWNQSVTRGRWLAVKLGLTGLAVMVAAALLCAVVTWWFDPIDKAVDAGYPGPGFLVLPRTDVAMFDARGIAPIGYAVFAFTLGATMGVLIRRTVAAMAATLVAFTVVQVAVPLWIRPHLAPAAHLTIPITASSRVGFNPGSLKLNIGQNGAWLIEQHTVNAQGARTGLPSWFTRCFAVDQAPPPPASRLEGCIARLGGEGYHQVATYQPAGHFWPLQFAETGIFLALALVLAGCCFWATTRRLSRP